MEETKKEPDRKKERKKEKQVKVKCKDHHSLYASIEQIDNMYKNAGGMRSCAV